MAKVKMKTHSGAKKRFSVSGSRKVTFQKNGKRHLAKSKNARRLRRLREKGVLSPAFEARLKAIMPYA